MATDIVPPSHSCCHLCAHCPVPQEHGACLWITHVGLRTTIGRPSPRSTVPSVPAAPANTTKRVVRPSVTELLAAAVGAVPGGVQRPGQVAMAEAVAAAAASGEHLLVQAGTG